MAPDERPFPPGDYPVVVVGSGPGGLQTSHALRRLGIEHAVLSQDEAPGGMFRRFPIYQRLISWTKPYAPVERDQRSYLWFDWNTLLAEDPAERAPLWEFMDGTSYFPARSEMERGLAAFAGRAGVRVRYGCAWEGTRRTEGGFVLATSDGEYRCGVVVFAIGTTSPWKPDIPGLESVPHYAEVKPPERYAGRRVFVIGKRNSGFELADGMLPYARQIVMGSPSPAKLSVFTRSTVGARARYVQPYEDYVLAGGTIIVDGAIQRVARTSSGWMVDVMGTTVPGTWTFEADDVIAATGFATPMLDLPALGVATANQGRLPVQSPWWESVTVPGMYFAGSVMQASAGLKKFGIPGASAAVQGFRFNAVVLARHIAESHFGVHVPRPTLRAGEVVDHLLAEATGGPALWNQQSYLARVVTFDPERGIRDDGIRPLALEVDAAGPDAAILAVETDDHGDIHPIVYRRRGGKVEGHPLASNQRHDFGTDENRAKVQAVLADLLGGSSAA